MDADVDEYIRVRWNDLVRTLLSLGLDLPAAEDVATRSLVLVRPTWANESRDGDVDVLVYATMLRTAERTTRAAPAGGPGRLSLDGADAVLTAGAGLSAYQAEQVLGTAVDDRYRSPLGDEWDDLYRGLAPVGAIAEAAAQRRRRRLLVGAAVVVVIALVLGLVYRLQTPDPTPPRRDAVPARPNPIPLAWWGHDTLQLADVAVFAPGLRTLAQAGPVPGATSYSAVFGDFSGLVTQVDADGTSTPIGQQQPDAPIVGSTPGRVAWVDPGDPGGTPLLVLWDTTTRSQVAALPVTDAGTQPVAIDGDDVYFTSEDAGPQVWSSRTGDVNPAPPGLLDAAGGVVMRRLSSPVALALPGDVQVNSARAALSDDGGLAVVWVRGAGLIQEVPEAASSSSTPTSIAIPPDDGVIDARFAPDGRLVVLASHSYHTSIGDPSGDESGRDLATDLLTCDLQHRLCVVSAARLSIAAVHDALVLAR